MLPTSLRLKNKKTFSDTFRKGKAVSNDVLMMKYKKTGTDELKVGFSAGIRLSKKASERNKVKRWMREAVRKFSGKMRGGYQIIFVINSKFPYEQMNDSLIR